MDDSTNDTGKIDENEVFLSGGFIILKVLTEVDVASSDWYGWFNDIDTTAHMQKHYYPNTRTKQVNYLRSLDEDDSTLQLGIVPTGGSMLIGVIGLHIIDYINRTTDISMVIGDKRYRHLIYAQEAMQLMIEHAFFTLNLNRITGGYVEDLKDWGLFLKRRFGFKGEGISRQQVFKNGVYIDTHRIGLLREEYIETVGRDSVERRSS